MTPRLEDLGRCFQGVIPAFIATCGLDGEPNVTYLSQVYYVDSRHVALSCQFFNKTNRNIAENPHATVVLKDPVDFSRYQLRLRFVHSEFEGPLFETMALRIQVIASHSGMTGIFKLRSADIYEVLSLEADERWRQPNEATVVDEPEPVPPGPMNELRGVQLISQRIARASCLEGLLTDTLAAFDEVLGFAHSMILAPNVTGERLVTLASRGYGSESVGAEVALGEGTIGTAAQHRRIVRVSGMGTELRYGRAVRGRVEQAEGCSRLLPEIPLPGLCDAQAQLVLPLQLGDHLVGVLAFESRNPVGFNEWDEAFLQILANQIAMGIDRLQEGDADDPPVGSGSVAGTNGRISVPAAVLEPRGHSFVYYGNDDCVFVDSEYLVRGVPGRILWKVLRAYQSEGRVEFTNRELRLDPSLGLPPVKDNLESRLILLRKRLIEKCPDVRLVPVRRGRFALEMQGPVELSERQTA